MSSASERRKKLADLLNEWPSDVASEPFNNAELSRKAQAQAAKDRAAQERG